MVMGIELLIPGVQYGGKTDLSPQALVVPGKLFKGPGGGLKEEIKDEFAVQQGQGIEFVRQGNHQVEVAGGQTTLQARCQPPGLLSALALGTVPIAAGIVRDGKIAAAVAANVHVSAQMGGAAMFDIPHGLVLFRAEAMAFAVLWAMVAKDLGHLQDWSGHMASPFTRRAGLNPGGSPASGPTGR